MAKEKKEHIIMLRGAKNDGILYKGGEVFVVGTGKDEMKPNVAKKFAKLEFCREAKPEEIKAWKPAVPIDQKKAAEEAAKKSGDDKEDADKPTEETGKDTE